VVDAAPVAGVVAGGVVAAPAAAGSAALPLFAPQPAALHDAAGAPAGVVAAVGATSVD
jgi:hypothetical protein